MTHSLSCPLPVQPRLARRLVDATLATFRAFAWACAGALAVIAVIHSAGATSWPFELFHHFLMAYTLIGITLAILAMCLRARRLAVVATALALFFAAAYARSAVLVGGGETTGRSLSLITNNVYCGNWNADGLRAWLATRPADIVALQEVPPHVERALAAPAIARVYPYSARVPAANGASRAGLNGCEGLLLLSTVPVTASTPYQPNPRVWPALITRLDVADVGSVSLVLVHALDPIRTQGLVLRDEFLASLAPVIAAMSGPVIVAGDFNATPFTPAFRQFLQAADLEPGRTPASFPANLRAFGIPIDHVLVRGADLPSVRALPPTGTDHRPIFAQIVLPNESSAVPLNSDRETDEGR
ncbi:MAG: endonuclease/exonuclease/phosphatase family protein [Rhodospirillales bacterium]